MMIILPLLAAIVLIYLVGIWIMLYHLMKFRMPHTPRVARHIPTDKSLLILAVTIIVSSGLFLALGYFAVTTPWNDIGEALRDMVSSSLLRRTYKSP